MIGTIDVTTVAPVLGTATHLFIVVNLDHGNTALAAVYDFSREELESDSDLRSILFGRVNSYGTFKACRQTVKSLRRYYGDKVIDLVPIADIETVSSAEGVNLGRAIEKVIVNRMGGRVCSYKEDNKKRDVLVRGHFTQVKCSLATTRTDGSYATTNDHI